ncbi:MAG: DUF3604 domain-containing protein [Deltaproteobacteria bacterium]
MSLTVRLLLVALLVAPPALADVAPFERTETREDCSDFATLRTPLFGDTHVHTTLSFDAVVGGVDLGPRDAYDFAKGAEVALPPYEEGGRTAQLRRPLDFTALSDHAEFFGEVSLCLSPGTDAYDDQICQDYRANIPSHSPDGFSLATLAGPYLAVNAPYRFDFCGDDGSVCLERASLIWQDIQDAAEEHYDRTSACTFTTFAAYEYTAAPQAQNLHRNVIFRNENVTALPIDYVTQPKPQLMWEMLDEQCIAAGTGCDVLAIPHNSNLSGGLMFLPENADGSALEKEDASFRSRMEPLVEITQHKGDSECRPGVLSNDELCGYEKMRGDHLGIGAFTSPDYVPSTFVRNALKEGLEIEQSVGANPFKLGFIGSTDTHGGTPGLVNEVDFATAGHLGTRDGIADFKLEKQSVANLGGFEANPGGLAVVWAEENARDAIFSSMRRREVYGTSGTRPILRFFGGDYADDLCDSADLVHQGYARGVPMGGELGPLNKKKSPSFAVMAMKDPGAPGAPSTPLQRIQIIKGWVDYFGDSHEKVFDVAGDPDNGASVDEATCQTSGSGSDSLCAVWTDPDFNPAERAFYYARVLENPVCRWSTHLCNSLAVDCSDIDALSSPLKQCCEPEVDMGTTIQERAWSSPIWYAPEGLGKVKAMAKVKGDGKDMIKFSAGLGSVPGTVDPNTQAITLSISDDDLVYSANIPAGAMTEKKAGRKYMLVDKDGSIDGVKKAYLKINKKGAGKFGLKTAKIDLPNADLEDHFVTSRLSLGDHAMEHSRLWTNKGSSLKAAN